MKKQGSALNPYAVAYIPLSKRLSEPANQSDDSGAYGKSEQRGQVEYHTKSKIASLGSNGLLSQPGKRVVEEVEIDEQGIMALDYLKKVFPDLSRKSHYDAYMFHQCDLEMTIDMLQQLELNGDDTAQTLPDTLDIGDVPEYNSSAQLASQKLKNVRISPLEGSSDSAGSSNVIF